MRTLYSPILDIAAIRSALRRAPDLRKISEPLASSQHRENGRLVGLPRQLHQLVARIHRREDEKIVRIDPQRVRDRREGTERRRIVPSLDFSNHVDLDAGSLRQLLRLHAALET